MEPPHNEGVRVLWAASATVVLGEAMLAEGHCLGPPCEGLIVQTVVGRPVEVFMGKHCPPVLTVKCNPGGPFKTVNDLEVN